MNDRKTHTISLTTEALRGVCLALHIAHGDLAAADPGWQRTPEGKAVMAAISEMNLENYRMIDEAEAAAESASTEIKALMDMLRNKPGVVTS